MKAKRKEVKSKNKEKINRYKDREKAEDIQKERASIPEACKQFEKFRVFNGKTITSEPSKEPFISTPEIKLSEAELKVLTKNPKFSLRNVLDKESFMAEVEKGLVKECYSRIGKEEDKGEQVEEIPKTEEEKQAEKDAKWPDHPVWSLTLRRGEASRL